MFKYLFSRKSGSKKCERCAELEEEINRLRKALETKDKLHRKELIVLADEITALRLINEKLMKTGSNAQKVEWDESRVMSKDFALCVIDEIRRFYRRIKISPESTPFSCEADFESAIRMIDGLKGFIEIKE